MDGRPVIFVQVPHFIAVEEAVLVEAKRVKIAAPKRKSPRR
jgi:hypothetical protein